MLYGTLNTDCLISLDGRVCLFDDTICHIIDDTIRYATYEGFTSTIAIDVDVVLPLPFKIQVTFNGRPPYVLCDGIVLTGKLPMQ